MLMRAKDGTRRYVGLGPKSIEEFKSTLESLMLEMKFKECGGWYENEGIRVKLNGGEVEIFYKGKELRLELVEECSRIKVWDKKVRIEKYGSYNLVFDLIRVVWKCGEEELGEEVLRKVVEYLVNKINTFF